MAKPRIETDFPIKGLPATEDWLPKYSRHVAPRILRLEDKKLMVVLRVTGSPFESVSDDVLKINYDNLTTTISLLGRDHGNRLAFWTTFDRRKVRFDDHFRFQGKFLRRFATKYLQRFQKDDYLENRFWITLILKYDDLDDGVKAAEMLADDAMKSLAIYDPECLQTYQRNDILFSEIYSFLGYLLNGVEEDVPVTSSPARVLVPASWPHFHYDTAEIRNDSFTRHCTCYDLKDFPKTGWGQLNPMLSLQAEFTLTQSFTCMTAFDTQRAIGKQINKLQSSGDKARHQVDELEGALGYIASGELAFGDYHGALIVYGDTAKAAMANGSLVTTRSKNECGLVWTKATVTAPWTYLSQMPAAKVKPRPQPKSTRNLASTFSLHDYSSGKSRGNPIGDGSAVVPLQTVSKKLYCYNYHATRDDESNTGEKVAGHTLMLGSTGVGKTVFQLVCASFFERFNPMVFGLDVGRAMEIWCRQIRGTYIALAAGERTGFSPLADLADTPQNRQFLYDIVTICARDENGKVSAEDRKQIQDSVDTVLSIEDRRARRFSRLLESIEDLGGNSLYVRLSAWCESEGGRYAWVFDNPPGMLPDIANLRRVMFDVSTFAREGYEPSEAVFTYIFHLKQLMQREGKLLMSIVEEFWLPLKYEKTRAMIEAVLAAGRKAGEFLVLVSQQPEQAISSPVFPQIRSLTATKVFLPDPEAEYKGSYDRCNMSLKEFEAFKSLGKSSRTFLIKQSNQSAFATLDLRGFEDEIAVLSSTPENVLLMNDSIKAYGEDPDDWLEPFLERVAAEKLRAKLAVQYGNDSEMLDARLESGMKEWREKKRIEWDELDRLAAQRI